MDYVFVVDVSGSMEGLIAPLYAALTQLTSRNPWLPGYP